MKMIRILFICGFCLLAIGVSAGELGDANADGALSIVDALVVAQYYVGLDNLPVVEENCDVDANGAINIIDALLIAQYFVGLISSFPAEAAPAGILIGDSGCKSSLGEDVADGVPINGAEISMADECLRYQYDSDQQILYLHHINAGFNCCAIPTLEEIRIPAGQIEIITNEGPSAFCDCNCLFDVDYEIHDLLSGIYTVSITSFYVWSDDPPSEFTIDLDNSPEGLLCLPRGHYPWAN
jgi:hypothetical protein